MAVDAQKIKDRLKTLFPKANLSKARLDAIAAKLSQKPADDADDAAIDEVINDYNDNGAMSIEELAKLDDKLRTLEAKQPTPPTPPTPQVPPVDEDPMKQLLNEFKSLKEELTNIKAEKKKETITERFNSDPRVKDIPEIVRKGYMPVSDEDFETNVETLVGDYKVFAEKHKLAAHGNDTPGSGNGSDATKPKQVSDADAKDMAKALTGAN